MKEQIKLLKKEYLSSKPKITMEEGLSDLWERIDRKPAFHLTRYILVGVIIILLSGGFFGAAVQAARPESPLYPIKTATNQLVSGVIETLKSIPEEISVSGTKDEEAPSDNPEGNLITPQGAENSSKDNPKDDLQNKNRPGAENKPDNPGGSISDQARQNKGADVKGEAVENIQKKKGPPSQIPAPNNNSPDSSNGNGNSKSSRQNQSNQGLENAREKSNNPEKPL